MEYHILIIEDNTQCRQLCERIIHDCGHSTSAATTFYGAREKLKSGDIDIIFLDIDIPIMDGIGVLQKLKSCPETKHIPIIMVSSQDSIGVAVGCIDKGALTYIQKDGTLDETVPKAIKKARGILLLREQLSSFL